MAAYQQVGSFQVTDDHGKLIKNGGNVASYFCTPTGRVIHAVTGPVNAGVLLDEAHWAVDAFHDATKHFQQTGDIALVLADAHRNAGSRKGNSQVHELFTRQPLAPLHSVFQEVFEKILGQRVSLPGEGLDAVVQAIESAKEQKLPILFALSRDKTPRSLMTGWTNYIAQVRKEGDSTLGELADPYVVVSLPLDLMPAVSQRLGMRPIAAPVQGSEIFAVCRSDGRQLTSTVGWNKPEAFKQMLAMGLVQEAKEHARTPSQLARLMPLATEGDPSLKATMQKLMESAPAPAPVRGSIAFVSKVAMKNSLRVNSPKGFTPDPPKVD